jgi:hypothetical protein
LIVIHLGFSALVLSKRSGFQQVKMEVLGTFIS